MKSMEEVFGDIIFVLIVSVTIVFLVKSCSVLTVTADHVCTKNEYKKTYNGEE